jgi:hypothetical protein
MAIYSKIARQAILMMFLLLEASTRVGAMNPQIRDASFEPSFAPVLMSEPQFITGGGGAKIIEYNGIRYFVAIGVTSVIGDSPQEKIRQLRVGRIQALKSAIEFINETNISSQEILKETTTVTTSNGNKSGTNTKTLDETTVAQIKGVIKAPPEVGSWKSPDGSLFYYAVGIKLK